MLPNCLCFILCALCVFFRVESIYGQSTLLSPVSLLTIDTPHLNKEGIFSFIEKNAKIAVEFLNRLNNSKEFELGEVYSQESQVGEAFLYTFTIELDLGLNIAFELIQPLEVETLWRKIISSRERAVSIFSSSSSLVTFESSSLSSVGNFLSRPHLPEVSLDGPLLISFSSSKSDLHLRVPNEVDVGEVKSIIINRGVSINCSNINSILLKNPLEVDLELLDFSNGKLRLSWKQVPHLEIDGNSLTFNSKQRVKVKRSASQELTFIDVLGSRNSSQLSPLLSPHFDIEADNPLWRHLRSFLDPSVSRKAISSDYNHHHHHHQQQQQQQQQQEYKTTNSISQQRTIYPLRKIVSAKVEALSLMLLPMELRELSNGLSHHYHALLSWNSFGEQKVLSMAEQEPINEMTIAPGLVMNSTLNQLLESFGSPVTQQSINAY